MRSVAKAQSQPFGTQVDPFVCRAAKARVQHLT